MKENSIAPSVTGLFGGNFHTIAPAIITSPVPTASPAKGLLLSFLRYNDFVDTVLILTVILAGFAAVLYALHRWTAPPPPDNTIAAWLSTVQSSLDNSARLMSDVQKSLGEMSEVGRGIKTLQDFLQSPKLRGGLGEEILKEMIGQTFPKNSFFLQYSFRSGVKADAVLKTEAGLLCIDSKFPMENFKELVKGLPGSKQAFAADIKKHITDISRKYILPEEGTLDFALMYIPSEAVYYEVVNLPEITKLARDLRVYPVSPNTLYAHLQVLLLSFQGKELEAKSREVFKILRGIQKDYSRVEENMGTLNRHLINVFNQMHNVASSFGLLGQKLSRTQTLNTPEDSKTPLLND